MATSGSITCRLCGQPIVVQFVRASLSGQPLVLQLVDGAPIADHMKTCAAGGMKALPAVSPEVMRERAGRIDRFLDIEAYISHGGSRACTMCGTNGDDCLSRLGAAGERTACCPGCAAGNTHPSPGEALGSCAEWAAEKLGSVQ